MKRSPTTDDRPTSATLKRCLAIRLGDVSGRPPMALGEKLLKLARFLPLLVPIILFLISLHFPPMMANDSGVGFLALRSMLDGGAFNCITLPDPANIARDVAIFLTWWSPGQYLVPGSFVWLSTSYGLALSLTALIATLIGVLGWIQVARSFAVSSFVLFAFVLGLNTFAYVTLPFQLYWGGELLLFATASWALYAMRWSVNKPPILCFTISLLSAALLFFAKLTGLIVFATNVAAISLITLVNQRRLNSSTIAMWVASAIGALCFMMFWIARGPVPAGGSTFAFSWLPIWFSITGAAFSGVSGLEFLHWFLRRFWVSSTSNFWTGNEFSYALGPIGLLLMVWVWLRLRHTRYRDMAVLLLTIILLYAIIVGTAMYVSEGDIPFEERYFRYAGILFFLLLLTALDQWRVRFVKGLACVVVIVFGLYGLKNFVTSAFAQTWTGYYDPVSGISQDFVSPDILQYLRSETTQHNLRRPILVVHSPQAALSLPRFRILPAPVFRGWAFVKWMGYYADRTTWVGRAERIFVVLPEKMLLNGKAEATLRLFTSYEFDNWKHTKLDGMIIYTQ
jgi:hypothetical protein